MTKTLKTILPLMALVSMVLLTGTAGQADDAKVDDDLDLSTTLPQQMELREFRNYKLTSFKIAEGKGSQAGTSRLIAIRKADKANLVISASINPTIEDSKRVVKQAMITNLDFGPLPTGSPSGRKIGEESYHSVWPKGVAGGSLKISARNGRSYVFVRLNVPSKDGVQDFVTANPKDIAFVERQALNVLNRLTTLEKSIKPK